MNLFILDVNVKQAAMYHCDKHVIKMILEVTQLLYSVHHLLQPDQHWIQTWRRDMRERHSTTSDYHTVDLPKKEIYPYKLTHQQHPCAIWLRTSPANYNFGCDLGLALCDEYRYRFTEDKKDNKPVREHQCRRHLLWLSQNLPPYPETSPQQQTPFVLAMDPMFKIHPEDAVACYRNYYLHTKKSFAAYTKRDYPKWLNIDPDPELLYQWQYRHHPKSHTTRSKKRKRDAIKDSVPSIGKQILKES
jgi:hypothetical protein